MSRTVLVYRNNLLPVSEPFILLQGESLTKYQAFYLGNTKNTAITIPAGRTMLLRSKGLRRQISRGNWPLVPGKAELGVLRGLRPALLHAHFGPDGVAALPIAAALKVPLVVTFHGFDINVSDRALLGIDRRFLNYVAGRSRLMRKAKRCIAVSEFIRMKLIDKGCSPEKITVHYIGVDTGFFSPSVEIERDNLVLFVGRLVPNKGCEYLLRAMRIVQSIYPNVNLAIIGDGEERTRLETVSRELELRGCTFLGSQPQTVVRNWMNRARLFCVPSIEIASGASEGFGLVFCEAQSMGLPVVSYRTGGIPEAIQDGRTGLLSVPRDVDGLAASILTLFRNSDTWETFSHAAREHVLRNFDIIKQTPKLENIYDLATQDSPLQREHEEADAQLAELEILK